ncbi:unnamed protein product [Blepharisma stoltei]|uniref:Uncharacterized protein n=1 Tax=Blepharisma stoltei TaxID=1481888 RepID=A0AAU9JD10_9CILI|nr:unnamed protein product [Blepharisma stoltei]
MHLEVKNPLKMTILRAQTKKVFSPKISISLKILLSNKSKHLLKNQPWNQIWAARINWRTLGIWTYLSQTYFLKSRKSIHLNRCYRLWGIIRRLIVLWFRRH